MLIISPAEPCRYDQTKSTCPLCWEVDLRVLARLHWRRSYAAAGVSYRARDMATAARLYEDSWSAAALLPPGDRRRRKSLSALFKIRSGEKHYELAIAAGERLLEEQRSTHALSPATTGSTLSELAALYQATGQSALAERYLERAIDLFREHSVLLLRHREAVRQLRSRGRSPAKVWRTLTLTLAGFRHVFAQADSILAYPGALEQLAAIRASTGDIPAAIRLRRELIDFKIVNDFAPLNVCQDLSHILSLQLKHGLFDADSPALAEKHLELLAASEAADDAAQLPRAVALLYASHTSMKNHRAARIAAQRGLTMSKSTSGQRSLESLRWLLLVGESSYALGEFSNASDVAQTVLTATSGDHVGRRREYQRALELQANAERSLRRE